MGTFLKIIIGVATCLTFVACGAKSDSKKAVDDANKSIEQTKKDTDKMIENAKKSGEEAGKANETVMDATSPGGQPGSISLTGAVVIDDSTLDSKVSVNVLAGKSWRGQRPDVNKGSLTLKAKFVDSTSQEIEKLKDDKTFVNLGCDISARTELKDLQAQEIKDENSLLASVIKANTVLLCGVNPLKYGITFIIAKTVIFSSAQQNIIGAVEKMLSITAGDLIVEGGNTISSKGVDGLSTVLQAPSISIGAEKISGNGKLDISSEGASYKGDAK